MKPDRTRKMRTCSTAVESVEKDPVEVYCRIRPNDSQDVTDNKAVITRVSPSTVLLQAPEKSRHGNNREQFYQFKSIYGPESSQSDVFNNLAKPLVEDLVNGKNGLLFAYGITGSGKTYTMEGTQEEPGIFRHTVDLLFKGINKYQAKRLIFKPDRMNGFDVLSELEASYERHIADKIASRANRSKGKDSSVGSQESLLSNHSSALCQVDDGKGYAIFVTYIQIYKKYMYDLLDDSRENQAKLLREDARHHMYIHDCTEVEVRSPQEAYEVLLRGQKKRKVASTNLNHESSRSHSVFSIRCVQAPWDEQGEELLRDKQCVVISQLALVDLAGSERTGKTKATGDRLKETGDINNSLMVLRQCIEILRENQKHGLSRKVPYRDSKLTHYFKNYFEGEGKVRMLVCVNPNAADYEETLSVMKFAELASEVQVNRATPAPPLPVGLTPGRRRAHLLLKDVRKKLEVDIGDEVKELPLDISPIYTICPNWPTVEFNESTIQDVSNKLIVFLTKRIKERQTKKETFEKNAADFRREICNIANEYTLTRQENLSLKGLLDSCNRKLRVYESKLQNAESVNDFLWAKFTEFKSLQSNYDQVCAERNVLASQGELDKQRLRTKLKCKLHEERERMAKELHEKFKHQQKTLKASVCALLDEKSLAAGHSKGPAPQPPTPTQPNRTGQKNENLHRKRSFSEGTNKILDDQTCQVDSRANPEQGILTDIQQLRWQTGKRGCEANFRGEHEDKQQKPPVKRFRRNV